MQITIHFGWWMLPAGFTLLLAIACWLEVRKSRANSLAGAMVESWIDLVIILGSTILALIFWLIWAVLT